MEEIQIERALRISQLINKHLQGELREHEKAELETWVAASSVNKILFTRLTDPQALQKSLQQFYAAGASSPKAISEQVKSRSSKRIVQLRVAAAAVVIAIVALYWFWPRAVTEEDLAAKQLSTHFQASVTSHKYKLASFYADKPIDYITTDTEVRSETDLLPYAKQVLNDEYFFGTNGMLTINRRQDTIGGAILTTIQMPYSIVVNRQAVVVNFIDYLYRPREYKLHEFDNAYFTVYTDGPNGSKLYSKYARVN